MARRPLDENAFRRLPKWAQSRIEVLEEDLEYHKKETQRALGTRESRVSIPDHDEERETYLSDYETVRFETNRGPLEVGLSSDYERIEVSSTEGPSDLYIAPHCSNVAHVYAATNDVAFLEQVRDTARSLVRKFRGRADLAPAFEKDVGILASLGHLAKMLGELDDEARETDVLKEED